jgi:hypothetical protein
VGAANGAPRGSQTRTAPVESARRVPEVEDLDIPAFLRRNR